jgi:hypothetical protein
MQTDEGIFLANGPRFLKEYFFLKRSHASPFCPGKNKMNIKMSNELCWNDTDRETP